ncbi:MAG: hypothetical protein JW910_03715 [Anaerolineae bacterium]|nr:hypothetical protein [Anaerolineae bacterium]
MYTFYGLVRAFLKRYGALLILGIAFALFAMTGAEPLVEGDGAEYAVFAEEGRILEIPSHAAYLAAGWLSTMLLADDAQAMALLSWVAGSLGIAAVYLIVHFYTDSLVASWLAGLAVMTAGQYWNYATTIEVYGVQAGVSLMAFAVWLYAEPRAGIADADFWRSRRAWAGMIGAGLLLVFAGLVTPASIAFAPMFLLGRDLHIPRRWLVIGGTAAFILGAIGVAFLGEPLMRNRALFDIELVRLLRNVAYMGFSMGPVMLATLVLAALSRLTVPGDAIATRRLHRVVVAVVLTILCHVPFATFIVKGALIPTYGLVALVFGLLLARFTPQVTLSGRVLRWMLVVLATGGALGAIGLVAGCRLQPDGCGWLAQQWSEHQNDVQSILGLGGLLLAVAGGVEIARRNRPGLDHHFLLRGGMVVLANMVIGLHLVLLPLQDDANRQRLAVDMLCELDPPHDQIVGSYDVLVIYDYYHLGERLWPEAHLHPPTLTVEQFEASLDSYDGLYVIGIWVWDIVAMYDIQRDDYALTPLGENVPLWYVQRPTANVLE